MGSDTRTLTIQFVERASEYELVHYIGHALYSPNLTVAGMKQHANVITDEIAARTGYIAFIRNIRIKQYPPFMTDIDFAIDSPTESPIEPVTIALIIAALKAALPIILVALGLVIVIFLWWDVWVTKTKLYICEQCPEFPRFEGYAAYMGHLAETHPVKYEAAKDAASDNWWEKAMELGAIAIIGIIAFALVTRRRD